MLLFSEAVGQLWGIAATPPPHNAVTHALSYDHHFRTVRPDSQTRAKNADLVTLETLELLSLKILSYI